MHHKVHNVLEPVAYGVETARGPYYGNSQEACLLVCQNAISVVKSVKELEKWLLEKLVPREATTENLAKKYIMNQIGVSDLILSKST